MLSSGIIDLAIGLSFVFGVTAAISSALTELIARFVGLRGAYLLTGLRELVDGEDISTDLGQPETWYKKVQEWLLPNGHSADQSHMPGVSATGALLGGPILSSQGMTGTIGDRKLALTSGAARRRPPRGLWRQRRSLPSYISARSFAEAVIDLVVPSKGGQTTMTDIQHGINALPDEMSTLKTSLQALATNTNDDIDQFRTAVQHWYDDHMDRVSGWYKRHTAKITLVIGTVLVVLLNLNALTIGRTLYTQSAVDSAVSTVAAKGANCTISANSGSQIDKNCLDNLQAQLSAAATAGLPVGWGTVRDCLTPKAQCNWLDERGIFSQHGDSGWQLVLVLAGFLLMIIALVPGARFWFGLLSKLGSLRTTGPKPTAAAQG